jgi:hypothetical protein
MLTPAISMDTFQKAWLCTRWCDRVLQSYRRRKYRLAPVGSMRCAPLWLVKVVHGPVTSGATSSTFDPILLNSSQLGPKASMQISGASAAVPEAPTCAALISSRDKTLLKTWILSKSP